MTEIITITDFSAPELDVYARLSEVQLLNRFEPEKGMFIAESPKVITRALNAGFTPISMLVQQDHWNAETLEVMERCGTIPIYTAPMDVLTQLTGFELTRGILCAMRRKPLPALGDIVSSANRIAVLENVMNPTNVGAIFRSAAALGMDAVLLTKQCSNPFYRRSTRVSMGTVFQVPWTYVEDDWMAQLHASGFRTAAMALTDNSVSIDDPAFLAEEKLAVILGTEGEGLMDATIASSDYTVKIPMFHAVDSLNVAAASAVAFWELRKRT